MIEYGDAGYSTLENRASDGCCIVCNTYVNGYYCARCAMNSTYESARVGAAERHGASPTQCGRALQRRVDSAVEYEQLQALWSCVDSSVEQYAESDDVRVSRSVTQLRLGSTRKRKRGYGLALGRGHKWDRWLRMWDRIGTRAARLLAEPWKKLEAKRYRRFCRAWRDVGWAALDAATRPEPRSGS